MKHACLIPARSGSKGIPGKNTKIFCGRPLVYWSIAQAIDTGIFDEICVSTDDPDVKDIAIHMSVKVIDRPSRIADDQTPMLSVIQHANTHMDADFITLLQPTNPLRFRSDILGVMDVVLAEPEDTKNLVVCSAYISSIYQLKGYHPAGGHRRQDDEKELVSGLVYCFSSESLYCWPEQMNVNAYLIQRWQAHELDEIDDWDICEYLFKERVLKDAKARNNCKLPSP